MATGLSQSNINIGMPVAAIQYRFTLDQYHDMISRGFFGEDEPIELIQGEVIKKMPIGNPHAAAVNRINRLLSRRLSEDELVSIQNPVALGDSEPEPDVAVLHCRDDLYASRRPVADDVQLLIEVAESSLTYDRDIKVPIYAAAGICDYWIINLNNRSIEVYRDPQPDGRYATVITCTVGDNISPLKFKELTVPVEEIVGSL